MSRYNPAFIVNGGSKEKGSKVKTVKVKGKFFKYRLLIITKCNNWEYSHNCISLVSVGR